MHTWGNDYLGPQNVSVAMRYFLFRPSQIIFFFFYENPRYIAKMVMEERWGQGIQQGKGKKFRGGDGDNLIFNVVHRSQADA